MATKKIRIGFDLDGVIIGKPFFVPDKLMEILVRDKKKRGLSYRFPESNLEIAIRVFSHIPVFRPPIKKNIRLIKELYKSKNYEIYVVSSRYSFLHGRTKQWFHYYKLHKFFKEIHINMENEQPHIFKAEKIKKLKLNVFIDDDKPLLEYLKKHLENGTELLYVSDHNFQIRR